MDQLYITSALFGVIFLLVVYTVVYTHLSSVIATKEKYMVEIFLDKISKIPALIEVMRPYVADEKSVFDRMIRLHSESIIHEYIHIPAIIEHNVLINDQYAFLMKLSMAIPELQKNTYFIYIRDYVISYDRIMRNQIPAFNSLVVKWNRFIRIKNLTLVGFLLPGTEQVEL